MEDAGHGQVPDADDGVSWGLVERLNSNSTAGLVHHAAVNPAFQPFWRYVLI